MDQAFELDPSQNHQDSNDHGFNVYQTIRIMIDYDQLGKRKDYVLLPKTIQKG